MTGLLHKATAALLLSTLSFAAALLGQDPFSGADMRDVVFGTEVKAVAVGLDGSAFVSGNAGDTWTEAQLLAEPERIPGNLTGVAHNGSVYVIASESGTVYVSADGENWTQQVLPTEDDFIGVSAVGSRFYVSGGFLFEPELGSLLFYSDDDGLTWERETVSTTGYITAVAQDATERVAVGSSSSLAGGDALILVSNSNDEWSTPTVSGNPGGLNDLLFLESYERYVAVGENGSIVISLINRQFWSTVGAGVTSSDLFAMAYDEARDVLVAVGDDGTLIRSDDGGNSWVLLDTDSSDSFQAVTFLGTAGTFLMIGDGGAARVDTLVRSPVEVIPFAQVVTESGGLRLGVETEAGALYRLEFTTDLRDPLSWTEVEGTSRVGTGSPQSWLVDSASEVGFWRVVIQGG